MIMKIRVGTVKRILTTNNIKSKYFDSSLNWKKDDDVVILNLHKFTKQAIDLIYDDAMKTSTSENASVIQSIGMFRKILANPIGTRVGNLKQLESVLKLYIDKNSKNRWLCKMGSDQQKLFYIVTSIKYLPKTRYDDAHVIMKLKYTYGGGEVKETSQIWRLESVRGKYISEILINSGYGIVDKKDLEEYDKVQERYNFILPQIGKQFVASLSGYGTEAENDDGMTYSRGGDWNKLSKDGYPDKLVVDEPTVRVVTPSTIKTEFWDVGFLEGEEPNDDDHSDDDEEFDTLENDNWVLIPNHPYIKFFNLRTHINVNVHANLLHEYKYDKTIMNKLILPKSIIDMLNVLIQGTDDIMEDIVKGKSGGSSGPRRTWCW